MSVYHAGSRVKSLRDVARRGVGQRRRRRPCRRRTARSGTASRAASSVSGTELPSRKQKPGPVFEPLLMRSGTSCCASRMPPSADAEAVAHDGGARGGRRGDRRRRRRRDAVRDPLDRLVVERALHHVLRDARERRQRAGLRLAGVAAGVGADVALAQRAVVGDQLPVAVRGARDLPDAEGRGVRPARGAVADAARDVALGVDAEDRRRRGRCASRRRRRAAPPRRGCSTAAGSSCVGAQAASPTASAPWRRRTAGAASEPSGSRPAGLRIAFTAWEKMS